MGTELLVAGLWGIVLVYWFWSRRPAATGDTVGVFQNVMSVLEEATPARVAPANTRTGGAPGATPAPKVTPSAAPFAAAATARHKRMVVRRRRRDVLLVLSLLAVLSAVTWVFSGSRYALALQVMSDVFLVGYLLLLVMTTRARNGGRVAEPARRPARPLAPPTVPAPAPVRAGAGTRPRARVPAPALAPRQGLGPQPWADEWLRGEAEAPMWPPALAVPAPEDDARPEQRLRPEYEPPLAPAYVPAHALRRAAPWLGDGDGGSESYGDFESYASLALASAR
ncbi:MAG TPA: hypothetical protein VME46_05550 [Acidimicrobiales bacterium]|nr:hypothetical protein [Acidimicrobiales bacterium]